MKLHTSQGVISPFEVGAAEEEDGVASAGAGARNTATLQILSVAMGVYAGGVGPGSVRGINSAVVNGVNITNASWVHGALF
jgi:hypothetical protein